MDEKQRKGCPDTKSNERFSRSRLVAKKKEFAREYVKLKLQEDFLEKSVNSAILNLKGDPSLGRRLDEEQLEISESRQRELSPLVNSTMNIVRELRFAKALLNDPSAVRSLNVEEFKSRLLRLTRSMEEFEGRTRLEELKAQETKLESELNEFERKISAAKSAPMPKRSLIEGKILKTTNDAMDEFGKLVCRTGHTENWSEQDHALFLKVRSKCDTIPLLVSELRDKCPDLTTEQIVNHEAWYKRYSKLRDERKQRIEAWKRKKERDRREDCEAEEEPEETPSSAEKRRKVGENVSKMEIKATKRNTTEMTEQRRCDAEKKRRMIEEWRLERQRKYQMDEEQKKRLEEKRAEQEKRRRKVERDKVRIKLEEYRGEKKKMDNEDRSKSDPNLSDFRRSLAKADASRLVRSFRQQDEEFIRKRLRSLNLSRKDSAKDTTKHSVAWKSARPRDCSTLLTATKGWDEKCKREPKTCKTFGEVMFVKDIPKLSFFSSVEVRLPLSAKFHLREQARAMSSGISSPQIGCLERAEDPLFRFQ